MSVNIHPQFVYDEKGKKRSVLLSVKEFNALLDELDRITENAKLRQLMDSSTPEDFVDLDVVTARLRAEGKID